MILYENMWKCFSVGNKRFSFLATLEDAHDSTGFYMKTCALCWESANIIAQFAVKYPQECVLKYWINALRQKIFYSILTYFYLENITNLWESLPQANHRFFVCFFFFFVVYFTLFLFLKRIFVNLRPDAQTQLLWMNEDFFFFSFLCPYLFNEYSFFSHFFHCTH